MTKREKIYPSPFKLVTITGFSVLFIEIIVMSFLERLKLPNYLFTFLDAIGIILLLSPILYSLIYLPMLTYINNYELVQKENEVRYSSFFENNHAVMLLINPESGDIVDANPAACAYYGYNKNELLSKKITEINTLVEEEIYKEMDKARSSKQNYFNFRHRLSNGEIRDVEVYSGLIISCRKNLIYSIVHDITERVIAKKELKKLYHAVEQSPSSVVITDALGNIEYVNPKFSHLTGYTRDEVIGLNPRVLKSGIMSDEIYKSLWETVCSGNEWRGEFNNKKKNGELFWEFASIAPIVNEKGQITNLIGVKEDITERKLAEEKISYLAFYDSLTGLPNRKLFNDRLNLAIAEAKRSKEKIAVFFLDLDGFKSINDTLGHMAGDKLLEEISGRLKDIIREVDTVSRFAGDEFTLIFSEIHNVNSICSIANKIVNCIKEPWEYKGNRFVVTASLGIAIYPNDGENSEDIIKHADVAMYEAKKLGKNNYVFFDTLKNY